MHVRSRPSTVSRDCAKRPFQTSEKQTLDVGLSHERIEVCYRLLLGASTFFPDSLEEPVAEDAVRLSRSMTIWDTYIERYEIGDAGLGSKITDPDINPDGGAGRLVNHHRAPTHRWRLLSAIIGDAARAFRRLAPMAVAEASAHALVAHYASDQVTAAASQAYMHPLPRIRLPCFAGFRNTDGCASTGLCYHRWGRACRYRHPRRRALMRVCVLRGGNRHRALTRVCALRYISVASGNRRQQGGSCLGFHRLRLHRHRHSRRRCGCVVLTGTDRLRGDFHHVRNRRVDAVRGIGTRDQDRRDGTQAPDQNRCDGSQAPARSQRAGGKQRLRHGCRDAYVAWCCPRRRRVSG